MRQLLLMCALSCKALPSGTVALNRTYVLLCRHMVVLMPPLLDAAVAGYIHASASHLPSSLRGSSSRLLLPGCSQVLEHMGELFF